MRTKADVVVVGAGPAGLFSASTAAETGVEVVVCEEHREVGLPSHCAGHISIKGLKRLGLSLPARVVENEIRGSVFYSPYGKEFRVRLASPITYVIDRALFDKHLAQLAERAGAKILLGTKVESLLLDKTGTRGVTLKDGELASKMVIDAEGCTSALLKQIGLRTSDKSTMVTAVQGDADQVDNVENDMVEVYPGQKYAPGLFAWIIPRKNGSAKVGLATRLGNPNEYMRHFCNTHPVAKKKLKSSAIKNLSYHLIPLGGPIEKTYSNGFLAVGDAASQVKPTTGGGVIMGLTCAKIAAETAQQAINENDFSESFLSRYQQKWQQAIGFDMAAMTRIRLMLNRLSDRRLDKIISLSSQLHLSEKLHKVDDIDFQGKALFPLLRSPGTGIVLLYSFLASIM